MIGKLFPRILNKSSDKSAIKPSEFIDAINVLVSSDDGGDGNVIKKVNGTISAVIEDPENFPFTADGSTGQEVSEVVIGHLVDEGKKRVYYFACSEQEQTSSVYLAKESDDGNGIVFMCLLRDSDLGFSESDFVASNVIRVPKKNIDSGLDPSVSGEMGDESPGFDDFNFGEEASNLYVLQEPESSIEFNITGAEWVDPSSAGNQYFLTMTFGNSGVVPATVNLFAQVASTSVTGVNVSAFPVSGQAIIQPLSQQNVTFQVDFDIVSPGVSNPIVSIVEIGFEQVDDGNLTGPPLVEQYTSSVTFVPPTKIYPEKAVLYYNGVQQGVLDGTSGSITLSNQPIPENDLYNIQGPFRIEFEGGVPGTYEYRPRISIFALTTPSAQQSPPFRYYFGGFHANQNDVVLVNPGITDSGEVFIESLDDIAASSFTFWLVKSYDTTNWIDNVENGNTSIPELFAFDYSLSFREVQVINGNTFNVALNFASGNDAFVELQHIASVQDIQSPAQISVQDFTASVVATEQVELPAHVEQGYNTDNGGETFVSFKVVNSGETDGFFQNLINPFGVTYPTIVSIYGSAGYASAGAYGEVLDEENGGLLKGFNEFCRFSVKDSSGNTLFSNLPPRSEAVLDIPLPSGGTLRGNTDGTYFSFLDQSAGNTSGVAVNIFAVPAEDFVTVEYRLSNSSQDFQYGYSGSFELSSEITNPTDYPSGVYSFYGGGPNNFNQALAFEVRAGLSNDLSDMNNIILSQNALLTIGEPSSGEMKVYVDSQRASNHVFTDPFMTGYLNNLPGYDATTNPNPMVAAYGQNEGELLLLAGKYPNLTLSTNPLTASVEQFGGSNNGFWGFVANPNSEPVDLIFYNNATSGTPATVVLESRTNISWVNPLEEVGQAESNPWSLTDVLTLLGNVGTTVDVELFSETNAVHDGYVVLSSGFTVPSAAIAGSLGTAWAAAPAVQVDPEDVNQNGFPATSDADFFAAGSVISSFDPDPTLGAYNYDESSVGNFIGPWFYGGWRSLTFDVPAGHFRRVRLYANFSNSLSSPNPGVEDYMNNTSFGSIPDYTNRNNVWGAPVAIRASWTGGINNPEPNLVGIGGAVLVVTDNQYSSITSEPTIIPQ